MARDWHFGQWEFPQLLLAVPLEMALLADLLVAAHGSRATSLKQGKHALLAHGQAPPGLQGGRDASV